MAEMMPAGAVPSEDEIAPPTIRETLGPGRLVPVLIGLMLGMLLGALDQAVVSTAMPHIISELGGTAQDISWVVTAYLLASTVGVPIYGKLSDIYGRRIFFLGGMTIFLVGSALSGTSQNMTQLIFYRAVQGLGAGALMPIAQAIIGDIFPPSERGKWQGLFVAVFGLATILGPLLGGWITDNWGWRWVFYINMPIGIAALITTALTMPNVVLRMQHRIDYLGSIVLVGWSVPLLLAVSWGGNQYAWDSWQIITLFVVAAVLLVAFLIIELTAREPIISPRLFKNSIFSVSVLATFLVSAGMFGAILYLPFFVQFVMGQTATNSGVILTPMMLGFMVSSLVGGWLLSLTGRYKILALIGFLVATVGMFLMSRMGVSTSNAVLVRNMVILGLGIGVMMSLFTIVVQNAFPFRQLGEVTATLSFFRSMGGTIGLAVLGSLFTHIFTTDLQANIPAALKAYITPDQLKQLGLSAQGGASAGSITSGPLSQLSKLGPEGQALLQQFVQAMKESFTTGIDQLFLIGACMMALGFIVTLFLREIPLRRSHRAEAKPAEAVAVESGAETGETATGDAAPSPAGEGTA